jgi:CIC family chloride channel protein
MKWLRAVQHAAWAYQSGTFLSAVERSSYPHRVLVMAGAGILMGLGRWMLRVSTGGHGGELSEAIWFRSGRLAAMKTLARSALSILGVGLGVSLGREGALKQTGAVAGSRLADWGRLSDAQRRLLAACGAGAGIAAAYNVPFGGALFALEVLLGTLALPLVLPALAASLIGTAISRIWLPAAPTYSIPHYTLHFMDIAGACIIGPAAGLASAIYIRMIAWADMRKPRKHFIVLAPVLVLTILGIAAIPYPQLLGNGKNVVQNAFTGGVGAGLAAVLLLLKPVVTAGCLTSGAPGGLFTPTMTAGALLGILIGHGWLRVQPGSDLGTYAILGSVAVLAAASQGPVSAVALLIDLTHRVDALMVPVIVAVACATLVSRALEPRSIYSARVHAGLSAAKSAMSAARTRFQRAVSVPCAVVSSATKYPMILERLLAIRGRCAAIYVVDDRGRLQGRITADAASGSLPIPCDTVTASDLASQVQPVTSSMKDDEVQQRIEDTGGEEVPVVDSVTGRLIGVVS